MARIGVRLSSTYTHKKSVPSQIIMRVCRNFEDLCILIWLNRYAGNQIFLEKLFFFYILQVNQFLFSCIHFTAKWNLRKIAKYYRQLQTILLYYRTILHYGISYKLYFSEIYYINFSKRHFCVVFGSFQINIL